MREAVFGGNLKDVNLILENIVYMELLRRGYQITVGKMGNKEVDFVAENQDGLLYAQASASVLDEATLKRELRPLEVIPDHHPKLLLTLDQVGSGSNYNGIRQLNLLEWL